MERLVIRANIFHKDEPSCVGQALMVERLGRTGGRFISSGFKTVSIRVWGAKTSKITASK